MKDGDVEETNVSDDELLVVVEKTGIRSPLLFSTTDSSIVFGWRGKRSMFAGIKDDNGKRR